VRHGNGGEGGERGGLALRKQQERAVHKKEGLFATEGGDESYGHSGGGKGGVACAQGGRQGVHINPPKRGEGV